MNEKTKVLVGIIADQEMSAQAAEYRIGELEKQAERWGKINHDKQKQVDALLESGERQLSGETSKDMKIKELQEKVGRLTNENADLNKFKKESVGINCKLNEKNVGLDTENNKLKKTQELNSSLVKKAYILDSKLSCERAKYRFANGLCHGFYERFKDGLHKDDHKYYKDGIAKINKRYKEKNWNLKKTGNE